MNKDVKEKWVEALRSGNFEQDKYQLRGSVGYCCLGVLCELAVDEGVIGSFRGGDVYPDKKVRDWAGLGKVSQFANMNDNKGYSFSDIATHIERYYKTED